MRLPFIRAFPILLSAYMSTVSLRAAAPAPEDTVLTGDHFDSRSTEKEVLTVVWDRVIVTGTNLRITCDRLETISYRTGDKAQIVAKQNRFKSLIALGHVKIFQVDSNREATCGRAEVLPGEDRITLTIDPRVVDLDKDGKPEWTWTGDRLLLLRGERRVQGDNVRITAPGIKDLGFDKSKAPTSTPVETAPTPAPAPPK